MFAVVKTGGKQYRVAEGDVLTIEKLVAEVGETVRLSEVLMLGGDDMIVGNPLVDGAAVQAEVVEQKRGPKTLNLKRRRRKHSSRRLKGHRQYLTTVRITGISASDDEATAATAAQDTAAQETVAQETAAQETAAREPAAEPETETAGASDQTAE